jgi:hypothetical protein
MGFGPSSNIGHELRRNQNRIHCTLRKSGRIKLKITTLSDAHRQLFDGFLKIEGVQIRQHNQQHLGHEQHIDAVQQVFKRYSALDNAVLHTPPKDLVLVLDSRAAQFVLKPAPSLLRNIGLMKFELEDVRTSKTRISDYAAIVDGNWNFNSNDALEGQTHTPKGMGICYKQWYKETFETIA